MVWAYILGILLFCVIIIFHEMGHLMVAKRCGIKVNEFWLGFGPTIVGFTRGETKYCIKAIPFGGACVMEGEDEESEDPRAFPNKPVWQRICTVASGPLFNWLMAFAFSVIILASIGLVRPIVGETMEGYPAAEAGIQAGDEITKLNHKNIHFYDEVSMYTLVHAGETIDVTYVRDGEKQTTTITPQYDEESERYLLGIYWEGQYEKFGPARTLLYGIYNVKFWIQYTLRSLEMLVTNQASVRDLSGPVGIVQMVGETVEASRSDGAFYVFLNVLNIGILLSANLGVLNLLPIPALDGGRLLFLVIEAIRGKRVDPNREGMVNMIGMVCLFALMAFVMVNDVVKLFI